MPATRQLGPLSMLGLWAGLVLIGVFFALWSGYSGRALAATLTTFAFFFLVMLLVAARGTENVPERMGAASGYLLGILVFFVYLIYAGGTNTFTFPRALTVACLVFIPLALASYAGRKPAGVWQDFAIMVGIWAAVKPFPNRWGFSMSHWLWPYPGERFSYVLTVLFSVNIALATFIGVRRIPGVGYSIGWGRHWGWFILASFLVFAFLAIPLGRITGFVQFDPQWSQWKSLPFVALGILFFTAWPEELLFRGLLQNTLAQATRSDLVAWSMASILFGFSHITNLGFPNWRYVLLASVAGFFYGWTWRKTGSIFASALVHAAVDITWHFLFRTL